MRPGQHLLLALTCTAAAAATIYAATKQLLEECDRLQGRTDGQAAVCTTAEETSRDSDGNAAPQAGDASQTHSQQAESEPQELTPGVLSSTHQESMPVQSRTPLKASLHQLPSIATCSKHREVWLSCYWAESFCNLLPTAAAALLTASQTPCLISKQVIAYSAEKQAFSGALPVAVAAIHQSCFHLHESKIHLKRQAQISSQHDLCKLQSRPAPLSYQQQGSKDSQQGSLLQQQQSDQQQVGWHEPEDDKVQHIIKTESPISSRERYALQVQPPLQLTSTQSSGSPADNTDTYGCKGNCSGIQSLTCMPRVQGSTAAWCQPVLACINQGLAPSICQVQQQVHTGHIDLAPVADASIQTAAWEAEHHLSQMVSSITKQQVSVLSQDIATAEQLSHQLQQQCSSLTADLEQVKQQKSALGMSVKGVQLRHDELQGRLMLAQQQLEQQCTHNRAFKSAAVGRLRCLLLQLQDDQQHMTGLLSAEPELMLTVEQEFLEDSHRAVAASDRSTAPERGQQLLTTLIDQLESQLLHLLRCREASLSPSEDSAITMQQLKAELQVAGKASAAATAEKQQLVESKKELKRKLSETQRQLQMQAADLAAVTNDRIAIAAAKTQLHHQLQALQDKQAELQIAVTEAQQAAGSHAQKAEELQEALKAAEDQLQKQAKESQSEVSLAYYERDNALHQVAELQLQLHAAQGVCAEREQQCKDMELQLQQATDGVKLLEQQMQNAIAAKSDDLAQIGQLQLQLRAATQQVLGLQEQMMTLEARSEGHAEQVNALQQQFNQASGGDQQAQQQLAGLQEQLQASTEQLMLAPKQSGKAEQAKAMPCKQADLERDLAQLKQRTSHLQTQHDAAIESLSATRAEHEQALQRVQALQQEVKELKQQHKAAEACAIELHMKLQETNSRCQQSEQQLAAMQEAAAVESHQLVGALGAAQARIAGSTQQMVEAQRDVSQLTKVVELQQQHLVLQNHNLHRLKQFILQSPLPLQLPDDLDLSSTATSPALSPQTAASPSIPHSPGRLPTASATTQHQQQATHSRTDLPQGQNITSIRSGQFTRQLPPVVLQPAGSPNTMNPSACLPAPSPPQVHVRLRDRVASTRHQGIPDEAEPAASREPGCAQQAPGLPLCEGSNELTRIREITSRVPSKIPSLTGASQNMRTSKRNPGCRTVMATSSSGDRTIKAPALVSSNTSTHRVAAAVGEVQAGRSADGGSFGNHEESGLAAYFWSSDGSSQPDKIPGQQSNSTGRQPAVGRSRSSRVTPRMMKPVK